MRAIVAFRPEGKRFYVCTTGLTFERQRQESLFVHEPVIFPETLKKLTFLSVVSGKIYRTLREVLCVIEA